MSPKDVSNALVVAAEAHRQVLSVYAQMVADGEQEKQRLAEGLVKCEAAYAGLLAEKEAASRNAAREEKRANDLLDERAILLSVEGILRSLVASTVLFDRTECADYLRRLDEIRKPF